MNAWMQTGTGRSFYFADPVVETAHLFTEIAPSLARIPRFNGHTVEPYSVAQHSVLCAEAAEDQTGDRQLAAYCLLHDAHEAYLGDMTRPAQAAIMERMAARTPAGLVGESRSAEFKSAWRDLKADIDQVIHRAAGLPFIDLWHLAEVGVIDVCALRTERDDLMLEAPLRWADGVEEAARLPLRRGPIRALAEPEAHELFVETLQRLCPDTAPANPARR